MPKQLRNINFQNNNKLWYEKSSDSDISSFLRMKSFENLPRCPECPLYSLSQQTIRALSAATLRIVALYRNQTPGNSKLVVESWPVTNCRFKELFQRDPNGIIAQCFSVKNFMKVFIHCTVEFIENICYGKNTDLSVSSEKKWSRFQQRDFYIHYVTFAVMHHDLHSKWASN